MGIERYFLVNIVIIIRLMIEFYRKYCESIKEAWINIYFKSNLVIVVRNILVYFWEGCCVFVVVIGILVLFCFVFWKGKEI